MLKIINGKNVSDGDDAWEFIGNSYVKTSDRRKYPRVNGIAIESDPSLIFNMNIGLFGTLDRISGVAFAQTYTGTNRTRITAANVQEAVAANTPVIDHVGASLTPALRMEPAAANILLEVITSWTATTATVTKDAVSWQGAANGAWTIVAGGADATVISTAIAGTSAAFTFVVAMKRKTGTGAVSITIDNGTTWTEKTLTTSYQYFNVTKSAATPQMGFKLATSGDEIIVDCLMLVPNTAIASSYFAPAAAIGAELVQNGSFAAVNDTTGELATGLLTIGNCYKISARTDGDFIAVGSPDNVVGTYFNATTTGVGLLDAGDKVFPVTFTNWTAGAGWAPQATAGLLTGKAQHIAGTASVLAQNVGVANKIYRSLYTVSSISGANINAYFGAGTGSVNGAAGTYYDYVITSSTAFGIFVNAATVCVIDDVSLKEHGTVRITEANTITLAVPAAVSAALAATGTLVVDWMPSYVRAAGVVTGILASEAATASLLYTTTAAGNLSSYDGTAGHIAESTAAYTANVLHRLALQWPSTANKFKVGASVAMAGVAYGAEDDFDGAFTVDANLIPGYTLYAPMWIKSIKFYNTLLTAAQVNALP